MACVLETVGGQYLYMCVPSTPRTTHKRTSDVCWAATAVGVTWYEITRHVSRLYPTTTSAASRRLGRRVDGAVSLTDGCSSCHGPYPNNLSTAERLSSTTTPSRPWVRAELTERDFMANTVRTAASIAASSGSSWSGRRWDARIPSSDKRRRRPPTRRRATW
jgi:hypothetical protein